LERAFFVWNEAQKMAIKIHFLTEEGRNKLEKELEYLQNVRRPEVARNLKAAIEEGDLRENAGYSEGKRDQALVEGRIKEIDAILRNARLLGKTESNGVVAIGSRVKVQEDGFDAEDYQVVSPAEADPMAGRISDESPIGQALMGHKEGDKVQVSSPGGMITFKILSVE